MNRQRRNRIELVMTKLDELREEIEALRDEEQEAFDNLPESLQEGERGEAMNEAIENLDSAAEGFGDIADYLSDAMGGD